MVGPSVTKAEREQFLRRLKIGFAILVGGSMALVTLWAEANLALIIGIGVAGTLIGGLLAEFIVPDSIAEAPYEPDVDRGPKPGTRMQQHRKRDEPTATDEGD
jgi:hypothetical protein